MTIRLDHTIVPAKDKVASGKFFAEIFGLTVSRSGLCSAKKDSSDLLNRILLHAAIFSSRYS